MDTARSLIQIILGSTRAGRNGEPVAKWLTPIPGIFRRLNDDRQLANPPVADAQPMLDDLVWWARTLAQARANSIGSAVMAS